MSTRLDDLLISLLHKHDHEPDEITKYVVINQSEFVPELSAEIKSLMLDIIGRDIEKVREVEGSSVARHYVNKAKAEQRKRVDSL